ncbi:MAG: DUF3352 domain-containing protein [Anaerolineaceae bacterium]|nr:DUF3352 domain-containing protein [Anaerolineaceae bacterium]
MLRRWIPVLLLLGLSVVLLPVPGVTAQGFAPSDRVPADAVVYGEAVIDENLEANLNELVKLFGELSGDPGMTQGLPQTFDEVIGEALPGKTFQGDILPWINGNVGIAVLGIDPIAAMQSNSQSTDPDFIVLLPVTDTAFVDENLPADFPAPTMRDDMRIYSVSGQVLVVASDMLAVGMPKAVDAMIATMKGATPALGADPAFQQTRAALPETALAWGYLSGSWVAELVAQIPQGTAGIPPMDVLMQAIFKLHPAESPMEDALMQFPPLNGFGFALELADDRLDMTLVMSLDAQYPAPELATATAGDGLLKFLPSDAFFVLDSYDAAGTLGLGAGQVVVLALMGPTIGNIFEDIVYELENPNAPTPTPRPTPTPPPPLTVDSIIAEAQPYIQQAEAMLGVSVNELYTLLAGEYAIALFNTDNAATNNIGGAFWFLSPDPARLSGVMDKAIGLLNLQMGGGGNSSLIRSEETRNGVDVIVWRDPQGTEGIAYGALDDEVFFITLESSLEKVLAASRGDGVLPQSSTWPGAIVDSYGPGNDLLLYTDVAQFERLMNPFDTRRPARQINTLLAALDIAENGLFRLTLTFPRSPVTPDA